MSSTFLLKLLWLGKWPKNLRLSPEQLVCVSLAAELRALSLNGELEAVWAHVPNEGKTSKINGYLLRAMGRVPGMPDFVFLSGVHPAGGLEVKFGKNGQTDTQKAVQHWCLSQGVRYAVVYSVQEAIDRLVEWKFITRKATTKVVK